MTSNNRVSNLVNSQVPFFVRNDHRTFVSFLEAYYEFLQQDGNVVERNKNLPNYFDIDKTLEDFSKKLYTQFIKALPQNSDFDKELVIKNVLDFYRSKGTEKSLRFLLRLLSNGQEAEFYYPKVDILKASDGKWYVQKALRIEAETIDGVANTDLNSIINFKNRRIKGLTSNAYGIVEGVSRYYEHGTAVDELTLSGTKGIFIDGETITANYELNDIVHTITANVFGGVLNYVNVIDPGLGYSVGDIAYVEGGNGSGANVVVTKVSTGNIASLLLLKGGAGFKLNDYLLFSGGGGSGANANVSNVDSSNTYHPAWMTVYTSIINLEANTPINNTVYSNLNTLIVSTPNANTYLANALNQFTYGPSGPINDITVLVRGENYTSVPIIDVIANTDVKTLGVLGRMEIINGGLNYAVGDILEFTGSGYGANGQVKTVMGNGKISAVEFTSNIGWPIGGLGFTQSSLPTINVRTSTGNGAVITANAIMGDGESVSVTTSSIGAIEKLTILSRGSGYTSAPTLNLTASGDGTAQAIATIITGVYDYPGRYLNDDGHLSSYNFLQDRDYYQNYSYVIKIRKSYNEYVEFVKNILHPTGLKVFGEYLAEDNGQDVVLSSNVSTDAKIVFRTGTYLSNSTFGAGNVRIKYNGHNVAVNTNVYAEFLDGNTAAYSNGIFFVHLVPNVNCFFITHTTTAANGSGNVSFGRIV